MVDPISATGIGFNFLEIKPAIRIIRRHVQYYTRYDENVERLRYLMADLEAKRNALQNRVDAARRNMLQSNEQANLWLRRYADLVNRKCEQLQEDIRNQSDTRRRFWLKYRIGRRVVKMIPILEDCRDRYDNADYTFHNASPPNVVPMSTEYMPGLGSMEEAKREVMAALSNTAYSLILVHGMGGVGKTTLMQKINNELEHSSDPIKFDAVIMVTVSGEPNYREMQDCIASRLGLHLDNDREVYMRSNKISQCLQQKGRVLIILDDVWERLNIDDLGIASCKIVITSRNEDSCEDVQRKIHMRPLTNEESWNLFSSMVGEAAERVGIRPTAENICKECGGLPLAINVIGSYLKGKNKNFMWKGCLHYLQNHQPDRIEGVEKSLINVLKLSYDDLPSKELRSCFLSCSLFPEDYGIHVLELTRIGIGEEFVHGGPELALFEECLWLLETLKTRGLLLEVDEMRVRMHDVVRDVAIHLATEDADYGFYVREGQTEWPRQEELQGRKRLSFFDSKFERLPDEPRCDAQIKTLLLMGGDEIKDIADRFFTDMPHLSTLSLFLTEGLEALSLAPSLGGSRNLRVFSMDRRRYFLSASFRAAKRIHVDMTNILKLRSLVVLCLTGIVVYELPVEIGELMHLKILDLSLSTIDNIRPNVLSRLRKLEELHMGGSFHGWTASDGTTRASVFELATLEKLNVLRVDVRDAEVFSEDRNPRAFQGLTKFDIRPPPGSDSQSSYLHSNEVQICDGSGGVFRLARWVRTLMGKASWLKVSANFEEHAFDDAVSMEFSSGAFPTAEEGIGSVVATEKRTQRDGALCRNRMEENIASSPLSPGSFQNLKYLYIFECHGLRYLFSWSSAVRLEQLEGLSVDRCDSLKEIISGKVPDVEHALVFPNLRRLSLSMLIALEGMCSNGRQPLHSSLRWLQILRCPRLNLSFLSRQRPPEMINVRVKKDWFESLEWEDEHVKNIWRDKMQFY